MNTIDEASDYAREAAGKAKETLCEAEEQLCDVEQKLMKACRNFISYHPIASMGIAVATGYCLSRLLSDRH
ncbi:MAG TPA: DUF883 domain-containing protein [Methylobacter sp.]|jgi:ElaB/YqjD/DUF883 family membrane-anchored ribosome-binding protein